MAPVSRPRVVIYSPAMHVPAPGRPTLTRIPKRRSTLILPGKKHTPMIGKDGSGLLNPGGNGVAILSNPFLLAGVYILVFSFLTRNFLLSVLTGIGLFMLLSQFLPM
ncbi:MAG: AzlD domain-containing protein [bacterium]